ncbi:hypothetical protein ACJVDH_17685 [Pedobacter sp. AW1-32]|uniref:hypothetical protein n=1 Tax=Pedobacter sp. AW1-32 TaxID=3383026 RepID=UPI003FEFC0DD
MRKCTVLFLVITAFLFSCRKKTDKDRAIDLVKENAETTTQKLDFDQSQLDSLYTISPKALADSIAKGNTLDSTLAILESQIEHFSQQESDSVGLISAKLTKERYRLLEVTKQKPVFIGWKLSNVKVKNDSNESLSFSFDKNITKIVNQ